MQADEIITAGALEHLVRVLAGGAAAMALGDAGGDQPATDAHGFGLDLGNADEGQQRPLDLGLVDVALGRARSPGASPFNRPAAPASLGASRRPDARLWCRSPGPLPAARYAIIEHTKIFCSEEGGPRDRLELSLHEIFNRSPADGTVRPAASSRSAVPRGTSRRCRRPRRRPSARPNDRAAAASPLPSPAAHRG